LTGRRSHDPLEDLRQFVRIVFAQLGFDQISKIGIDLDGSRRNAKELTSKGRGARTAERI